jgi:hypothetical protein
MASTTVSQTNSFLQRLIGAMALDPAIYEEVEADPAAASQAFVVVILSSMATGIGALGFGGMSALGVGFITITSLLAWAAWALVTFEVGVRIMPAPETRSNPGELLRTIGFAATPGILNLFAVLPSITAPVFLVTSIWMLLTMIVAVRHALDYRSTARAVAVCVLGWTLALTIALVMGLAFGPALS